MEGGRRCLYCVFSNACCRGRPGECDSPGSRSCLQHNRVSDTTSQRTRSVILKRSLCTPVAIRRVNSSTSLFSSANHSSSMGIPVRRRTLQWEQKISHPAFNVNTIKKKKAITMTDYVSEFPENIMIYSRGRALITSSDEHVAHLMKAGRKCNKAAKVIRSATSHFAAAHTPHIGLWREI